MKYLKEKKEFEEISDLKLVEVIDGETSTISVPKEYKQSLWKWITSKFQSHDRKMLEWCEKETTDRVRDMLYVELELDSIQVLKGMVYFRKWLRQLINQKLKEIK